MKLLNYFPIILFVLAILSFILLSLVLLYHWRRYGKGDILVTFFETAYFVVGVILLIISAGVMSKF